MLIFIFLSIRNDVYHAGNKVFVKLVKEKHLPATLYPNFRSTFKTVKWFLLQLFQTLHLFDIIHSHENKKYSYIFLYRASEQVTSLKQTQKSSVRHTLYTRRGLNTTQCVSIAAQVSWMFQSSLSWGTTRFQWEVSDWAKCFKTAAYSKSSSHLNSRTCKSKAYKC